ncbi:trypsin-like serine protease [Corynebacterium sp. ES2794-CONJ1]|uniref:trypsin-like serine protease n=1 Tax=unclassified Corynebacterium TaxID=2624378 RepID=UPI002166D9C1|nr:MULTISPECIES: trypsin-like serine protease [unclassified Corynebacterium]MCS4489897.1 trypsin-like serine protease [Corynebacterium sp. ES2775-CONJ]MCS4491740.1 trypsin-like serine protease [Corynebacterium sp. ES2715-CONJ3]MCS4531845.1 trypsin-like serine protease [Corynebacterium sp. ES2730-CONJ]MCU9519241.1 trypsin-like serine protease [Corynebacterium sp. ES2794-CONJ1]
MKIIRLLSTTVMLGISLLFGSSLGSVPEAHAVMGGRYIPNESVALVVLGHSQCSGTVIAPTWVLSAKHCVHQGPSLIRIKGENFYPTEAVLHPHDDLALLRLHRPTSARAVPLSSSHLLPGEHGILTGFGAHPNGQATTADAHITRRVHRLPAPLDTVTIIESNFTGGRISQGDSGGPLFDDSGALAGVQSAMTEPGTVGFITPVAEHSSWISRHAGIPAPVIIDRPAPLIDASQSPTVVPLPAVPPVGISAIESLLNYQFDIRVLTPGAILSS